MAVLEKWPSVARAPSCSPLTGSCGLGRRSVHRHQMGPKTGSPAPPSRLLGNSHNRTWHDPREPEETCPREDGDGLSLLPCEWGLKTQVYYDLEK